MNNSNGIKKYIAGYRSNNRKNKKIANIYYIIITFSFIVGSARKIDDFALLAMMLVAPSLIFNFKSMFSRQKEYIFPSIISLALVLLTFGVFDATYVEIPIDNKPSDNVVVGEQLEDENIVLGTEVKPNEIIEEESDDTHSDLDGHSHSEEIINNADNQNNITSSSGSNISSSISSGDNSNSNTNVGGAVSNSPSNSGTTNNNSTSSNNKVDSNVNTGTNTTNNNTSNSTSSSSNTSSSTSSKNAEIHFINTGNSDAILIKQGNKAALIDGGDNDDETRVVNYLKSHGVTELEYVFATHAHADHIGGLDAVIKSIPVKRVYVGNGSASSKTYTDFINAMANKGLSPSVPLTGAEFSLGNGKIKVLSSSKSSNLNNTSLVLLYTNGNDSVLLMGDAEKEIESNIRVSNVDLIKIGHHGSNTSSSSSFINRVNPKYAVITVGANNKYGHPGSATMNTLKNKGIKVHRTDECGSIVFKSSGNGLSVNCKAGSYNSGDKSESSSNSTSNSTGSTNTNNSTNIGSSSSSSNTTVNNNTNTTVGGDNTTSDNGTDTDTNTNVESNNSVVYWTPSGKSYHSTDKCTTLSRSKTILSGTLEESGKDDPCNRCVA